MTTRRTAAEIIATHLMWDIADVRDERYQPTRYASPAIYNMGGDYFSAPSDNRAPKADVGQPWEEVGEYYGRKVFRSKVAND
jgi:hypothetical protein